MCDGVLYTANQTQTPPQSSSDTCGSKRNSQTLQVAARNMNKMKMQMHIMLVSVSQQKTYNAVISFLC